jgi:hypothetical protein
MEYSLMAIESQPPAVQLELTRRARIATDALQRFAQAATPITAAQGADINTALAALQTALGAAGAGPVLPATQVIVSNGGTVNVENSAGALDSPATAVVAGGALTGVNLGSTKTILTNALKFSGVTITGTGTFFTPTITAGVLTGGVLSAS